jgi:hypothetical protein
MGVLTDGNLHPPSQEQAEERGLSPQYSKKLGT